MHRRTLVETRIGRIVKVLNYVGMATLFLVLVVFTTLDVILRYVFRMPFRGAYEIDELALAVIVLFALAYAGIFRRHIAVDLVIGKLPGKARMIVTSVHTCIGIAVWGLIGWYGVVRASYATAHGEASSLLAIPTWPFRFLVPLGAILLGLVLVAQIVEDVSRKGDVSAKGEVPHD